MLTEVLTDTSGWFLWCGWSKLHSQLVLVRRGLDFYGERTSYGEPTLSRDSSGLRLLIVVKESR